MKSYLASNVIRAVVVGAAVAASFGSHAQSMTTDAKATADIELTEVTVTGSRVITNGNDSPTPVTVVSMEELQVANPGLVSQALALTPALLATPNQGGQGSGGAAVINLRGVGAQRSLILFDGHRVAPTTAGSGVDTNLIPSLLLKRVDIVTGGASAVYGSDAVSGVVNFIIDNNFNGVKVTAQAGESTYNDDHTYKFGIAAGTPLFGGRGHIEFSYLNSNDPGIPDRFSRGWGRGLWTVQGGTPGSAAAPSTQANPYLLYGNTRFGNTSFGGLITSGPLSGQQFAQNGVLSPFVRGAVTGTPTVDVGGDGAYYTSVSAYAGLNLNQAFGRFDFDFTDTVKAYADVSVTTSLGWTNNNNASISSRAIGYNNAFLGTVQQPQQATIAAQRAANPLGSFNFSKIFDQNDAFPAPRGENRTTDYMLLTGINGSWGKYKWDVGYGRTDAVSTGWQPYNYSNTRLFAALNAVVNPANGQVVCNAALANPAVYGNCVPLNVFGPTASNRAAFDYIVNPSQTSNTNLMDDVTGSISGAPIVGWAGPIDMALSAEWRKLSYAANSTVLPSDPIICAGIQFNCVPPGATNSTTPYASSTANFPKASVTVKEYAYEFQAPLLKNVFLAKSIGLNGAARYTNYSNSGNVWAWKLGATWALNDALALRGARSRDIRAPTMQNLFAPPSSQLFNVFDIHTSTTATLNMITQGTPSLQPELADTTTAGIVWTPQFLEGFSLSLDYYHINIGNGLTTFVSGSAAVQQACENSNGSSPLCALYVRPFAFSNHTAANFPLYSYNPVLNTAGILAYGLDMEIDYAHHIAGHDFRVRALANYQPHLINDLGPAGIVDVGGAADGISGLAGTPNVKGLLQVNYEVLPGLTTTVQERYRNAMKQNGTPSYFFAMGKLPPALYTDLTVTYRTQVRGNAELFFNIKNLLNKQPDPWASAGAGAQIGSQGGWLQGDDPLGRYYTAGVRYKF